MSAARDAWARWDAAVEETTDEAVAAAIEHGNAVITLVHNNPAATGRRFWTAPYRYAVVQASTITEDVVIPATYEATAWTRSACRAGVQRSIAAMIDDVDPAAVAEAHATSGRGNLASLVTPLLAGAAIGLGFARRGPAAVAFGLATTAGAAILAQATHRYRQVAPFARPAEADQAAETFGAMWDSAMSRLESQDVDEK